MKSELEDGPSAGPKFGLKFLQYTTKCDAGLPISDGDFFNSALLKSTVLLRCWATSGQLSLVRPGFRPAHYSTRAMVYLASVPSSKVLSRC